MFWGWAACGAFFLYTLYPPRQPVPTPSQGWATPQPVKFLATDGVALRGWKCLTNPARPWIILCHGLGTNRADLWPLAEALAAYQFNLFLFDFRAHGESQGRMTSLGWREQRDVEGALTFLGSQPDVAERPVGLLGISMGGAVGMLTAAQDERIGAIAVESPYASLDAALRQELRLRGLPVIPCLWFLQWTYRLRFGVLTSRVSPLQAVSRISPRPILLIHGEADARVPAADIRRLYEAAGQPKTLWMIPGVGHLGACEADPEAYLGKLTEFFESSLA